MRALSMLVALACCAGAVGCGDDDEEDAAVPCELTPVDSPPAEVAGCGSALLYESPPDAALSGPWPVGARTVSIDGRTVEVWYPAELGSESCGKPKVYDLRSWLPESERGKIPDSDTLLQICDCRDGLPLDTEHGPYPLIVFVHGTAGFRTQSLAQMTHWASRGFVVVAADHPGLYLGDALQLVLKRDLQGDVDAMFAALAAPSGSLGFLSGHIDLDEVGMSGHSAGGVAVQGAAKRPGVKVVVPLAAGGSDAGPNLKSTLVMGALSDQVVPWDKTVGGYDASPPPKRLVGIAGEGHLFPTDLCWLENASGDDMLQAALKYDIENAALAGALFDCPEGRPPRARTRDIVNAATSGAFEETLQCASGEAFDGFASRFPEVGDFREDL
jgi:dienelactone hydrolase